MKSDTYNRQVVVRLSEQLDDKLQRAAASKGLTKASWVRQTIIEKLEENSYE